MSEAILKSLVEEQQNLIHKLNSTSQEVSFLFGAGTSVSAKLPDMNKLTEEVQAKLKDGSFGDVFGKLVKELKAGEHIEHILSFLEEAFQLNSFSKVLYKDGNAPYEWAKMALEIKKAIANVIEGKSDLTSGDHRLFAKWLLSRKGQTEVYTTNYDFFICLVIRSARSIRRDGKSSGPNSNPGGHVLLPAFGLHQIQSRLQEVIVLLTQNGPGCPVHAFDHH